MMGVCVWHGCLDRWLGVGLIGVDSVKEPTISKFDMLSTVLSYQHGK